MICPRCARFIRRDESLTLMQFDGGSQHVCQACAAQIRGEPPEPPRVYAVLPDNHPGYPFMICGLCRRAMFFDDTPRPLRLMPDQVDGTDVKAGLYSACRECRATWAQPAQVVDAAAGVCDPETGKPDAVPKTGIAL